LLTFKENLKKTFGIVIKNSIDNLKINGFCENFNIREESFKMLDNVFEKRNYLDDEIVS